MPELFLGIDRVLLILENHVSDEGEGQEDSNGEAEFGEDKKSSLEVEEEQSSAGSWQ